MKLLDTGTRMALLRGRNQVLERRAAEGGLPATTWVTASELFFG